MHLESEDANNDLSEKNPKPSQEGNKEEMKRMKFKYKKKAAETTNINSEIAAKNPSEIKQNDTPVITQPGNSANSNPPQDKTEPKPNPPENAPEINQATANTPSKN